MTVGLNTAISGVNSGVIPFGSMSQYLDDGSIFGVTGGYTGMTGMGYGYGFGLNPELNNAYYNMMIQNSDNMSNVAFVNRGNQQSLNSYGEIMQKNLPEVAEALRNGDYGTAARLYDEVYEAVGKNYGREITNHSDRLNMDQSIKATISRAYQQINGTTISSDARVSDEGYFMNGFMQGLTMNNHHKSSSEEIESYMTGKSVEGYGSKKFVKGTGKTVGIAANISGWAAVGAAIGSFTPLTAAGGAAIGAGIGALVQLGTALFGKNEPTKVTEA